MSLNANNAPSAGGNFTPMEAGTYPARVVQVVDIGLQPRRPFQGQEKEPVNMIALTYEFLDEFVTDEDGQEDTSKPRWLTETFAFYGLGSERAKSTKRYNTLIGDRERDGEFGVLVDTPCNVTVVINPGKGKHEGKVFANIGEVTPMRAKDLKKWEDAALVNEPVIFDLDEPNLEDFAKLPQFLRDLITQKNLEFNGSPLQEMLGDEAVPPKDGDGTELDDEVPF
jgi:hypothetical protein|tara:strand:- start:6537 stop:7211 length:675 start_codon:yes stop_codon:yes gene_type:complete